MSALAQASEATVPSSSLRRGVDALVDMQRDDGSWEGECVWCPMLTAQYSITAHIIGLDVDAKRRQGILAHFRATRSSRGVWGLHPLDDGSLFVTTLVYVAARLLGARADESWLQAARRMFEAEGGAQAIPTWGKVWLAFLGLYRWEGVNPITPEIWALPSWLPVHPANYYCHTRSIYLGLATLYGARFEAPRTALIEALRGELYPVAYDDIDFAACANLVRADDAPFKTSTALRAVFAAGRGFEALRPKRPRERVLRRLRERMRRDLRASDHLSLSPVNGLLTILALFGDDPEDADLKHAVERFDAWFWEDAREGSRVAGAGSVCWDSSFALQALAALPDPDDRASRALDAGSVFLASQQIEEPAFDYAAAYRIDPSGGWCFSEIGHGWPVSDCTAEALLGLLHGKPENLGRDRAGRGVRFILRCQNRDGGFGSYEPQKTTFPLEWMNPAEMFGRCLSERSYVECTGSCLMALAEARRRYPGLLRREIDDAVERGRSFLIDQQNADGTWDAAWGVRYVYAIMFGVRGLLTAGVPRRDPRIRRACRWLLGRQQGDGGWGERQPKLLEATYVAAERSTPEQTAWAMITLLEADEPDHAAVDRAARYLESSQLASGEWPEGAFVGVFFETALLSYRLYRQYFPVMALALHARSFTGQGRTHASTTSSSGPRATT